MTPVDMRPDTLAAMALTNILAEIDQEIAHLQQARSLLASSAAPAAKRGRPKKSALAAPSVKPAKKKRNLSPEGRARIAEAVKKRWATQKAKQKTKA
jgi:hypothetical protein